MNQVIAVVVTYNRKELLKEALQHLFHQSASLDILVVDNASNDGTKELLTPYIEAKQIQYYNTQKNLGGAGGFHIGTKLAVQQGYEYIWLMDDDTMAQSDALERLLIAKDQVKEFGFLASDVRWIDDTPCVMNVPNVDANWNQSIEYLQKGYLRVKHSSFVSCFVNAKVVKELGLPIKEFFIWGDDSEYTRRISLKYPCYFVSDSKVIHKIKQNIAVDIIQETSDRLMRYEYAYRNQYYVICMDGFKKDKLYYHYKTLLDIVKVLKSNTPYKKKKVKLIWKSWRAARKFKPTIEYVKDDQE